MLAKGLWVFQCCACARYFKQYLFSKYKVKKPFTVSLLTNLHDLHTSAVSARSSEIHLGYLHIAADDVVNINVVL